MHKHIKTVLNGGKMRQTDILVIGGGPSGGVAAITARKNYKDKSIVVVRKEERGVVPCGIPYTFNRLGSVEDDATSNQTYADNNIDLVVDEVTNINTGEKKVTLKNSEEIQYEKLILALGSAPAKIPIEGIEKEGVWPIRKDLNYLTQLREAVVGANNVVIIGGGFIGVEIAEDMSSIENLNVSIVEHLDTCLITTLDEEFAVAAESKLREKGVNIITGVNVEEVTGEGRADGVRLSNGETLPADVVIMSIGARPNVGLVKDTEIRLGMYGGIWVDEYMRTSVPDVLAVGDCAETRDFFTGKHIPVMLASTAATEARIAGANLYQLKLLRENKGTLGSFCTSINGLVIGATGMTEARAEKEGFDVVVGEAQSPNHHPGTLPGTETINVKLIFARLSGTLLGAQVSGPATISELTNMLALAVQQELTAFDFDTLQISTHPLLTPGPTAYPVIAAAQQAIAELEHLTNK